MATSAVRISASSKRGRPSAAPKPQAMPSTMLQCSGTERRPQRDPPSVEHAREEVPTELVGPEPVVPARRAGMALTGSMAYGPYEVRSGAAMTASTTTARSDPATTAPSCRGSWRLCRRAVASPAVTTVSLTVTTSSETMARIERRVQDVDDERGDDECGADEDDDALEDVVVALEDRLDGEASQPGNTEDVLDDDGAAERVAHDQAEHRQARSEEFRTACLRTTGRSVRPLPRRPDVRLAHLLEERGAQEPVQQRGSGQCRRQGGEHEVSEIVARGCPRAARTPAREGGRPGRRGSRSERSRRRTRAARGTRSKRHPVPCRPCPRMPSRPERARHREEGPTGARRGM